MYKHTYMYAPYTRPLITRGRGCGGCREVVSMERGVRDAEEKEEYSIMGVRVRVASLELQVEELVGELLQCSCLLWLRVNSELLA